MPIGAVLCFAWLDGHLAACSVAHHVRSRCAVDVRRGSPDDQEAVAGLVERPRHLIGLVGDPHVPGHRPACGPRWGFSRRGRPRLATDTSTAPSWRHRAPRDWLATRHRSSGRSPGIVRHAAASAREAQRRNRVSESTGALAGRATRLPLTDRLSCAVDFDLFEPIAHRLVGSMHPRPAGCRRLPARAPGSANKNPLVKRFPTVPSAP